MARLAGSPNYPYFAPEASASTQLIVAVEVIEQIHTKCRAAMFQKW